MTPCSQLKVNQHFRGTCRLHLQGQKISQENIVKQVFLCQLVNTATSLPADDVYHYVIPPKLLLTNTFYFQQTSGIHVPVGKGCSLSGRSPAPIADSFNVATMVRKHSVLNLQEINRNNKHTALASV
jgi:hypothetical protein